MAGMIPLGAIEAASELTTADLITRPTQAQFAVDGRVDARARPIAEQAAAEYLGSSPGVAAAAEAAVSSAVAGMSLVEAKEITSAADVHTLAPGRYWTSTAGATGAISNRPPIGNQPATIDVVGSGSVRTVQWTVVLAAANLTAVWEKRRDNGGNWSSWTQISPSVIMTALSSGQDIGLLPAGTYYAQTTGVAGSLVGRPPESVADPVVVEVTTTGGVKVLRWTTVPAASSGRPPRTWIRAFDNGGAYGAWMRTGPNALQQLTTGQDVRQLAAGTFWAQTSSVGASLVNGPSIPADAAIIEVVGDTGVRTVRWTTVPNQAALPREFVAHRDNAGGWSAWREVTKEGAVGPDAGNVALRYAKAAQRPFAAADPSRWFAPVGVPITTPTHDGSGQGMHPSVLRFPGGKFGYEWWMACTPYPGFNDAHEDPNILVSTDGNTWTVPPGAPVPLDDAPGTPTAHNSDTHLVVMHDGRLAVSWRMVDRLDANKQHFYWRTYDGTTWTAKAEIFTSSSLFVSQALVQDGAGWRMYGINASRDLVYYSTTNPTPGPADWTGPTACPTTPGPASDRDWWHVDVQKIGAAWWGIVSDVPKGATGDYGDIFLMRSSDGVNWDVAVTPLTPRLQSDPTKSIDSLYKTGFVVGTGTTPDIDVFLSGYSAAGRGWSTWRTNAKAI